MLIVVAKVPAVKVMLAFPSAPVVLTVSASVPPPAVMAHLTGAPDSDDPFCAVTWTTMGWAPGRPTVTLCASPLTRVTVPATVGLDGSSFPQAAERVHSAASATRDRVLKWRRERASGRNEGIVGTS